MLLYRVVRNGVTGFSAIVAGQPNEVRVADLTGRRGSLGASTLSTEGLYIYFEWEEPTGDLWVADLASPPIRGVVNWPVLLKRTARCEDSAPAVA